MCAVPPSCRMIGFKPSPVIGPSIINQIPIVTALISYRDERSLEPLRKLYSTAHAQLRTVVIIALKILGHVDAAIEFSKLIASSSGAVRREVVELYAKSRDAVDEKLLSQDFDGRSPWIDPRMPITEQHILDASGVLEMAVTDTKARYQAIAQDLQLEFEI